jgi:hypothetical protein
VYQSIRALGFEPALYVYYHDWSKLSLGVLVNKVVDFPKGIFSDDDDVLTLGHDEGGIIVRQSSGWGTGRAPSPRFGGKPEPMEWVTPMRNFNRQQADVSLWYGNEASSNRVYGDVCLAVRIGKAGDRLAFTTVAEQNEAGRKRQEERRKWRGY